MWTQTSKAAAFLAVVFGLLILVALLGPQQSTDSPEQVATDRLIGKWVGRLDLDAAEEDERFSKASAEALRSVEMTYRFKYNDALQIQIQKGDMKSSSIASWRVVRVDGETAEIETQTRDRISDPQPLGRLQVTFAGEDEIRLRSGSGEGYPSVFRRVR